MLKTLKGPDERLLTMSSHLPIGYETGLHNLSVTAVCIDNLKLRKSAMDFEKYESSLFEIIRSKNNLESLRYDEIIQSYRELHWAYSMDPTKTRVSSEAVLRRVLKGENLWRVSNLVDVVNLASAYHKIPIGLIDLSMLNGKLTVRKAKKGEIFQRIGGDEIECRGRELVVSDEDGIVCYGFAIYDSERTKVTDSTSSVLLLLYGSPDMIEGIMSAATSFTIGIIKQWVDCSIHEPIRFLSHV